ncbi:hypothetical protein OC846_003982 [Tilletia horrida]|uniref:Thioesterase domain-containing protein n=1 Tax=Tilletia horrida TaxID=155126 RepID=A0AAN6GR73_9BASI|nr:hypothetical protein OC846_003982 [Tilletia horrida]
MEDSPLTRPLPRDVPVYELLRIRKIKDEGLDTHWAPEQSGRWAYTTVLTGLTLFPGPNVFGGISFALSVQAAYESIHEELGAEAAASYAVYSFQGSFCSPAPAQHVIQISVETIRKSRSFITRLVTLCQNSTKDGSPRKFLVAVCDFVLKGRPSMVEFDTPSVNPVTLGRWKTPSELPPPMDALKARMQQARAAGDDALLDKLERELGFRRCWNGFCELVTPPESLLKDNFLLRARTEPTSQDHLSVPRRRLADWFRILPDLSEVSLAQLSAQRPECVPFRPTSFHKVCIAFLCDQVIPAAALAVAKVPSETTSSAVTLDFSVRFHRDDDLDANQWFLREVHSHTASSGRSLNMATVWDGRGRIVATVTEQCLYSPRPPSKTAARL